ncbi:MAG: sugar ABC transporter permease [Lachnospiraceae bacterium]|nr:sugar ABC transporter permease [Lachnospiraceae bacterium]
MGRVKRKNTEGRFAYALLFPSLLLLVLLIGYPMLYNIVISFQKVPLNPRLGSEFIGLANYAEVLQDKTFYHSVMVTLLFTVVVTVLSTILGLVIAIFMNREFVGKKLVNAIIILSYVVPSVCLIFTWRYMFNSIYGIVNYVVVDVLHLTKTVPLWFDRPVSAFILVTFFCLWRFYPYAYMSFVAILQSIDRTLYEAADLDGASKWQTFLAVTFPAIKPTMVTVVSLRTIWVFYIYTEVYLLTKQVDVLGVYLYDMAFATHDFGKAAAISILLFALIFGLVLLIRRKVLVVEDD